ncbi:MAG: class I SAM-dependent methyltransferase [Promethearchaeota archaeon]
MSKGQSSVDFKFMAWFFKIRDVFSPPKTILEEVGIKSGFSILDYGCGPGSFSIAAAELVGENGKVYALDILPFAVQRVQKVASMRNLENVEIICSDCATGLPDNSMDVVLLYDTLHDLSEPNKILKELHRILKPKGTFSFNDHHLKKDEIIAKITGTGLFEFSKKGKKTYSFVKKEN